MDLIFIGIQGSGKGTQAKSLAQKFGYEIFETGGALRRMAQENSDLGRKVKEITERGDLVPNEIVMEIVENFLEKMASHGPVIFDGIPRSQEQRQSLQELLLQHGRDFTAIEIKLEEEEAVARLLRRAQIEGRADDNLETIQKRIHNFFVYTQPLLAEWKKENKLVTVDGSQSVEAVEKDICKFLNL